MSRSAANITPSLEIAHFLPLLHNVRPQNEVQYNICYTYIEK